MINLNKLGIEKGSRVIVALVNGATVRYVYGTVK